MLLASRAGAAVDAIVTVAEDASAYAWAPDVAHGAETELRSSAAARAFLQFRLPPPGDGAIVAATLVGSHRTPYYLHSPVRFHDISLVTDDAWSEATLTWNAQPGVAPTPLAQIDITQLVGSRIVVDATAVAQAAQMDDGRLSLRIAPAAGAAGNEVHFAAYDPSFQNSENTGFRLELEFDRRPHARTGDLLRIETDSYAPFPGVIAADPETFVRKHVASMVFPEWIWDLARDPADGSLLALDRSTYGFSRLLRFDAATGNPSVVSEADRLGRFSAFVVDPGGDFYATGVEGPLPRTVVRIDAETGTQQVVWTDTSTDDAFALTALAVGPEGSLLVARSTVDWWTSEIVRVDPSTGSETLVTTLPLASDMAVAADGALWVVSIDPVNGWNSHLIRVDFETGAQTAFGATPEPAEFLVPEPSGTLLVLAQRDPTQYAPGGGYVDRFDPATGSYTRLFHDNVSSIGGLIVEPDGSWTAAWTTEEGVRISRHDPGTYAETVLAAPLGPFPIGWIAVDRARRLLALPETGWRIAEIDIHTGAQRLVTSGRATAPWPFGSTKRMRGIAVAPDQRLFTVEAEDEVTVRLQEIDRASGTRTDLAEFDGFHAAISVAPDGGVFVATAPFPPSVASIVRIDPATGEQTPVTSGGLLLRPYTLAVDPVLGSLVVGDSGSDQLFRVDLETGAQQLVASLPSWFAFIDGLGGAFVGGPLRRIDLATGATTPFRVFGAALLRARCSDGFDNDGDGGTDWPADAQCTTPEQDHEQRGCGLGVEIPVALALVGLARTRRKRFA